MANVMTYMYINRGWDFCVKVTLLASWLNNRFIFISLITDYVYEYRYDGNIIVEKALWGKWQIKVYRKTRHQFIAIEN